MTRASTQAGILEGGNPSKYDPKNPVVTFIIHAGVIIIFCRILHCPLSYIRQPRVIAEVISGMLLGPSVMGRVPGFTAHIFPVASMPTLNNAATIGLILFLFLVGLEVDLRLLLRNWRVSLGVGAAGMALPFGLGCALAYGLYHQFRDENGIIPINFGTYVLFVGVAIAITAFPVLCRILTELNLLHSQVGVVVLSAGIGNDIVGWILLALCIALVNAGSEITALCVFLVALGYILLLWVDGPDGICLCFFTSIIGIHPIFGAFLIGIICPHNGYFANKLTEKTEDLVAVSFLPLYFAISGLSTDLGLLNDGITWAYLIAMIAVAFCGKVIGGTFAARASKMVWRESFTIGVLMSCKGLVELIVLNIGLQAKILSQRTFTMFVVMALVTTFATTPLVLFLFPPWYQEKITAWKQGEIDWDTNKPLHGEPFVEHSEKFDGKYQDFQHLLVCLRLDSLPSSFTFISLLVGDATSPSKTKAYPTKDTKKQATQSELLPADGGPPQTPLKVHGLRVLELTERLSSVMKESEMAECAAKDPFVNDFYTFGQLNSVATSGEVQVINAESFASVINGRAQEKNSDLILLPWSETGNVSELESVGYSESAERVFRNESYNQLIGHFLSNAPCIVAIMVSNKLGSLAKTERPGFHRLPTEDVTTPIMDRSHHVFCPFTGGADDRAALRFVLKLIRSVNVTATILLVNISGDENIVLNTPVKMSPEKESSNVAITPVSQSIGEADSEFFQAMRDSVPEEAKDRVVFDSMDTSNPKEDVHQRATAEVGLNPHNAGDLIVVGRSTGHDFRRATPHFYEPAGDIKHTLGGRADAVIKASPHASMIVIQAPRK